MLGNGWYPGVALQHPPPPGAWPGVELLLGPLCPTGQAERKKERGRLWVTNSLGAAGGGAYLVTWATAETPEIILTQIPWQDKYLILGQNQNPAPMGDTTVFFQGYFRAKARV